MHTFILQESRKHIEKLPLYCLFIIEHLCGFPCIAFVINVFTTKILNFSRRINVLKFSRAIGRVNVPLKTSVSQISSVSIIRVGVVNGRMSLIFIPVCPIDASSYWCVMQ
jgi:hypothetical protein